MKTFYFSLLLITNICTTQAQWTNQNFGGGRDVFFIDDYTGWISYSGPIQFIDQNTGWILGGGNVKKTTNSGIDWTYQTGAIGKITKSTDGGETWSAITIGTNQTLYDFHFSNLNIGYVVGDNGTILKSSDGGLNWVLQNYDSTYDLVAIDFVDPLIGYAVGGRDSIYFLKTTNGGLNWSRKTIQVGYIVGPQMLNCVEFIDQNVGWVGSGGSSLPNLSGRISKTTDGGETWSLFNYSRPASEEDTIFHQHELIDDPSAIKQVGIRSIYFKDANYGYAVGGTADGWQRTIFATSDAGNTWQRKYSYSEQSGLYSIFVTSAGKGWALGYSGVVYVTEDNGSSWTQILSGGLGSYTGDRINCVFMINDSIGWAAGSRKGIQIFPLILKTTNGGKIWKTIYERVNSWSNYFFEIYFLNNNVGWAYQSGGAIFKTIDGGYNWFSINTPGYDGEVFFINQDTGWVASTWGISKTINGGTDWVAKSSGPLNGLHFTDINNGWATGLSGRIQKSSDQGENWVAISSGTTSDLNSIHFHNNSLGICVGNSGTILFSTNGGENWNLKTNGYSTDLNSAVFTNMTTAWIAGSGGLLQKTTNLGNSWIEYSISSGNLNSLHFINENTGWVVDGNNNIFKYSVQPILTLNFPNGGEWLKTGWNRTITWTSENLSYVNLYYSYDNGSSWIPIVSNLMAAIGSYEWEIPLLNNFIEANCRVKIEDASNNNHFDVSDNAFNIWHPWGVHRTCNLGQQVVDFFETNVDISLNIITSGDINVTYYPGESALAGTLPNGVVVVSDYYWHATTSNAIFNNGKMIIPISSLRGVTDASKLVWLKRSNSGDPWENIGGFVSGINLESIVSFNSFSEFAIGSSDISNPLPVELSSFTAICESELVILKWETKTETNNYGFDIERKISNQWKKIGFIIGNGNSNSPKTYSYLDKSPIGGCKFQYRLKQIDSDGQFKYSDVVEIEMVPDKFALYQNYPNPFNPVTTIRYQLPTENQVVIKIYNILGSEIMELVNEKQDAGTYQVEFNAENLSSGSYIYRITAGSFVETKKMILLK